MTDYKKFQMMVGMLNSSTPPYRSIISDVLQRRQLVNRSYSLRAYARDLDISPASLSLILSGRQGLSARSAAHISERLRLSEDEKSLFMNSVLELHSRSEKKRHLARQKGALARVRFEKENENILFRWHNLPILEYLRSHSMSLVSEIARVFDLSQDEAQKYLNDLQAIKAIKKVGSRWQIKKQFMAFGDTAPSRMIKAFHLESMRHAAEALETQELHERSVSSTFFRLHPKKREQAFAALAKFRKEFCIDFAGKKALAKDEIYCLAIQFFRTHRG